MPRAIWKGRLAIEALTCEIALYAAASQAERVSFHTLNRATGNRVRREYIDRETEEEVERDDQVKGYETDKDRYVLLEPEEIAAALPDSDKTLRIEGFIACDEVDTTYFDRPYFVAPAEEKDREAYELLRAGLRSEKRAAIARTILFRRLRAVLIRPAGDGLVAHTLSFDYEVKPAEEAFADIPEIRIEGEMLDLAEHIIKTKSGKFDPAGFDDRYDAALAALVKAKREGREIKAPKKPRAPKVVDLMEALRASAGAQDDGKTAPRSSKAAGSKSGAKAMTGAKSKTSAKAKATPKSQSGAGTRRKAS